MRNAQRRNIRRRQLQNTCDRLQVPAVVAVRVMAGILDEGDIAAHRRCERWRAAYREEKTLLDDRQYEELERRRRLQIASFSKSSP